MTRLRQASDGVLEQDLQREPDSTTRQLVSALQRVACPYCRGKGSTGHVEKVFCVECLGMGVEKQAQETIKKTIGRQLPYEWGVS